MSFGTRAPLKAEYAGSLQPRFDWFDRVRLDPGVGPAKIFFFFFPFRLLGLDVQKLRE